MMRSEFIERVGFEPTADEYAEIESEYMGTEINKDQFCKEWRKNGGVQRLMRLRARRIEELEAEIAKKDRQYTEMDARHCREFNEMHDRHKVTEACLANSLTECKSRNIDLMKKLDEAENARKEAEDRLETVRAAFAILGIGKEKQ